MARARVRAVLGWSSTTRILMVGRVDRSMLPFCLSWGFWPIGCRWKSWEKLATSSLQKLFTFAVVLFCYESVAGAAQVDHMDGIVCITFDGLADIVDMPFGQ